MLQKQDTMLTVNDIIFYYEAEQLLIVKRFLIMSLIQQSKSNIMHTIVQIQVNINITHQNVEKVISGAWILDPGWIYDLTRYQYF